jgi:hypothetical protein
MRVDDMPGPIFACPSRKEEIAAKNKYKAPEIKFNNAVTGGSSAADGSASAAKAGQLRIWLATS